MAKDPLNFNKIAAAILAAILFALGIGFVAPLFVQPDELDQQAYVIMSPETQTQSAGSGTASAPVVEDIKPLIASANIERGQKLSKKCASCHSFNEGGPSGIGPNIYAIVGAAQARDSGFNYSDILKTSGNIWDYDELSKFLANPKKNYPGTKMNFIGFKKIKDRADLIAWLRTLSSDPFPLP
ncbi:MAG: cytochrome c family protein [Pseudomonadota bacterium]